MLDSYSSWRFLLEEAWQLSLQFGFQWKRKLTAALQIVHCSILRYFKQKLPDGTQKNNNAANFQDPDFFLLFFFRSFGSQKFLRRKECEKADCEHKEDVEV
jgi:hypothetical protein